MKNSEKKSHGVVLIILFTIMALGVVVAFNYLLWNDRRASDLPIVRGNIDEDLNFVESKNRGKSFKDLEGKILLVNYIYTNCPSMCGGMTTNLVDLQKSLKDLKEKVVFVSISMDPKRDKPKNLIDFAQRFRADLENWWWITGNEGEIRKYMQRQFKFAFQKETSEKRKKVFGDFSHAALVALVDKKMRLRDVYTETRAFNGELEKHVRMLLKK